LVITPPHAPIAPSAHTSGTPDIKSAVRTVSVRGEALCTHCILHQTKECQVAVRVRERGHDELLVVSDPPFPEELGPACCSSPVPVLVEGTVRIENGRQLLAATRLEVQH